MSKTEAKKFVKATDLIPLRTPENDPDYGRPRIGAGSSKAVPLSVQAARLRQFADLDPETMARLGYLQGMSDSPNVAGKVISGAGYAGVLAPTVIGMMSGRGRSSDAARGRSAVQMAKLLKRKYPYSRDLRKSPTGEQDVKAVLDARIHELAEGTGLPEDVVRRIEYDRTDGSAEYYPGFLSERLLGKVYWYPRDKTMSRVNRSATVSPGNDSMYLVRALPVDSLDKDLSYGAFRSPSVLISRRGTVPQILSHGVTPENGTGAYLFFDRSRLADLTKSGDILSLVGPMDLYTPTTKQIVERSLRPRDEFLRFAHKLPRGWGHAPANYRSLSVLDSTAPYLSTDMSRDISSVLSRHLIDDLNEHISRKFHEGLPYYVDGVYRGKRVANPAERAFEEANAVRLGTVTAGGAVPEWKVFGDIPATGAYAPGVVFTGPDPSVYTGVRSKLESRGIKTMHIPKDERLTLYDPFPENPELKSAVDEFQRPFHQDAKGGRSTTTVAKETYDTPIPWELRPAYDAWYKQLPKNLQYTGDYDLQGAWLERLGRPTKYEVTQNGHLDDYGKKPNHPTFSSGSKWHDPKIPERTGGEWKKSADGSWDFYPGSGNVLTDEQLKDYFDKYEKGSRVHPRNVRQAAKAGDAGRSESSGVPSGHNPALDGYSGPRVVVNPSTFRNEKDAMCVAWNESFRILMEVNGFDPVSEPTERQRKFFSDTAYNNDELMLRRTILARICTFDTSVRDPTDEQLQEAVEFLDTVMEIGAPQNEWEQQAVKRIRDTIERTVGQPRAEEPSEET